jgi:adenosine kinase
MQIFVSGSLAYDRIMDFPGKFAEHIMPDKIHILNVSFMVNGVTERPGGTSGNIAYALALLGEKPTILATVGRDYQRYFQWLGKHGLSTHGIRIIEDELTAGAYITTDLSDNQITAFNPGAMKYPSLFHANDVNPQDAIAIVAPGNIEDMVTYSDSYRTKGIGFIFDPGQSIPAWEGGQLAQCIEGAQVLISNDYELELIIAKTGLQKNQLLQRVGAIITTKGEHGSLVTTRSDEISVPAVKPPEGVVDPTGAGDAYRGGLLKGLVTRKDLLQSIKMGAVCASFAIACQGTQAYHFTLETFNRRLLEHFPEVGQVAVR